MKTTLIYSYKKENIIFIKSKNIYSNNIQKWTNDFLQ